MNGVAVAWFSELAVACCEAAARLLKHLFFVSDKESVNTALHHSQNLSMLCFLLNVKCVSPWFVIPTSVKRQQYLD
jgi:hypothetical protein